MAVMAPRHRVVPFFFFLLWTMFSLVPHIRFLPSDILSPDELALLDIIDSSSLAPINMLDKPISTERSRRIGQLPDHPFDLTKYDTIFFYHSRKAGGTTIRKWLNSIAWKHNLTMAVQEGTILTDDVFNNHTLYITSLRDPVERAISSYWFEGRWPQLNRKNRNDENGIDLQQWTKQIDRGLDLKGRHKLYVCASDCFCKWFGSNGRRDLKTNVTSAMERLKRFDLVIQTERVQSDEYRKSLQILLHAEEYPIMHHRRGRRSNQNSTYTLKPADMEHLNQINRNDKELYSLVFG